MLQLGHPDGTFTEDRFIVGVRLGHVADVNHDGLPDLIDYDAHALHALVNERNETNHPPIVPSFRVTTGQGQPYIDTHGSDPDQQLLWMDWYDSAGERVSGGFGDDGAGYP